MSKELIGKRMGKGIQGRFRSVMLVLFAAVCLSVVGTNSHATEGGGGAYPNGAEDFMSGAVPPPGTYLINYFDYYAANKLADKNGNDALPGFKLRVTADVLRLIHITDKQILGGFWGFHLFLPVMNVDVNSSVGVSGNKFGLGDIIVDPVVLSWHGKNWHAATGVDIYMPTGSYDKNDFANVGRNYWTFEPILAGTYVSDSGYEASAKLMYDINTRNDDASKLTAPGTKTYLSGHEFHADYALGKKIGNFNLGMAGYYYQQVTNDEANGATVPDSKGRVLAFGPALKYDYKNMAFSLKYQFETLAENRPEGNNLWFKFVYAF